MITALAYLVLLSSTEIITNLYDTMGGIIMYSVILVILLVHSSVLRDRNNPTSKLVLALMLVPLVRMMSLFLPVSQFEPVYWYIIIYPPLFIASWVAKQRLNYSDEKVGFVVKKLPLQMGILFTGFIFGFAEYYVLQPAESLIPELEIHHLLLSVFVLGAGTGLVEEFLFRGVLQQSAQDLLGRTWGLLYVSFLFGILHLIHYSLWDVVLVSFIGLFYGWVVNKTGSLLGAILSHTITNVMLFVILPFVL